jgi:hypothetical protein
MDGATDDVMNWSEFSARGSKFKLYGFLRLDAIFDDSRPNNTQTIAWIKSEDPTAPATIGADDDDSDFTMHARLTRLGLDFAGPDVTSLGSAKLTGKVEIDFYNNGLSGQSESRAAIRMRHAWLALRWTDVAFLAGQTDDVISPIFPIINNDLVMWGAGNLGDRRPQLRGEYAPAVGAGRIVAQGEVGLSGADDNQDLDAAGTSGAGYRDGETSGLPTLQARLAWKQPVFTEKQNLEVGAYVHRAWEEPDTSFNGEDRFDSVAYGFDAQFPLWADRLWIKGEAWTGKNVDDVRGGIFQGVNTTLGRGISSRGGFAEIGFRASASTTLHAGVARDNPENDDLNAGSRSANRIWYVAARGAFDTVDVGFEYQNWVTQYQGFDKGDDNRVQAFIAYRF